MTETELSSWICTGTSAKPHPEIENWGENCSIPGCSRKGGDAGNGGGTNTQKNTNTGSRKEILITILAGILGLGALGGGAYFLKDKIFSSDCPAGQTKQGNICITVSKSSSQTQTPTSPSTAPQTQTTTVLPQVSPDWLSNGDRALNTTEVNLFRERGIEAVKAGNFAEAATQFEKAVLGNRNDPEVQIYLNNAKAHLKGSPLVIATVLPFDNRLSSAKEMLRGIADAQTQFNDSGGVGGRLVEILIANDGNEATRAQSLAQNLVGNPNILGVIGHNSSKASQAALAEYEKAGLAMISPTSTSTSLTGNVFFRTLPSDAANGQKLAAYAKQKLSLQKVAVFYNPNSTYSKSLFEAFEKSFQQLGGEIFTAIDLSKQDFNPQQEIQALRDQVGGIALFPDTDTVPNAITVARTNMELPGQKFKLVGGDALYSSDTITAGGNAVDGLVIAIPWFSENQPYAQAAEKRWLGTINWRTATSFDATKALLSALSNNPTRASVLQNLKAINLPASQTSGLGLKFTAQGERQEEPMLVKVTKGIPNRPKNVDFGFQLIR